MKGRTANAAVVLTAAGSSRRMGLKTKKEFLKINGNFILQMSLHPFILSNIFSQYIIVLPKDVIEIGKDILSSLEISSSFTYVTGGTTRQESVYNGLLALEESLPEIVLIHDGARPWVSESIIEKVYRMTALKDAAIPVIPSTNAMKSINASGTVITDLERKSTVAAQTPQGFCFNKILTAHKKARYDHLDYVDDAAIYGKYMGSVETVTGDISNKKITYISDLQED